MVQCDGCSRWYDCHCVGIPLTKATALAQWKCIKCNSNPTIISQEPSSNISIETINNPQQKLAKTTIKSDDRIAEYPIGVGDFVFLIGSQFTHL